MDDAVQLLHGAVETLLTQIVVIRYQVRRYDNLVISHDLKWWWLPPKPSNFSNLRIVTPK